jgi:site-specific DNA-cytosine methylase
VALTHASFFSGAGGLDLGLERAGWETVSFSEIDPYASAVLAERWPGVPNLGDITALAANRDDGGERDRDLGGRAHPRRDGLAGGVPAGVALVQPEQRSPRRAEDGRAVGAAADRDWTRAQLWTGGFPCQDLSVAGKRRGMVEGTRSNLAYAFLELVGRHRPRFVLLENVPGLLSSHGGRDMAALIGALVELGYGVGYRVLDARYFGVPQRRRRVFIVGDSTGGRAGAERAAAVLSVGSRCRRHPPTGVEAGEVTTGVLADGATSTRTVQSAFGHHGWTLGAQDVDGGYLQLANAVSASAGHHGHSSPRGDGSDNLVPDVGYSLRRDPGGIGQGWNVNFVRETSYPRRDGASDGLAGRSHDRGGVVGSLDTKRGGADDNEAQAGHLIAGTLRVGAHNNAAGGPGDIIPITVGGGVSDEPLLPAGLDSNRYRCCGNGVVADVAEWLGTRLAELA